MDETHANRLIAPAGPASAGFGAPELESGRGADLNDIVFWHGGLAGILVLATIVLWLTVPWSAGVGFALAVAAVPAVGLLIARNYDGPRLRLGLVIAWALAGGLAAVLTGGPTGPLAAWQLAPIVAAGMVGGPRRLAQGVVLALLALGAAALAQAAGMVGVQPSGPLGFGLALIALATTTAGAAGALALTRRRASKAAVVAPMTPPPAQEDARALLDAQPHLILVIDPVGGIERAFGRAPASVASHTMRGDGLIRLVGDADRPLLREALNDAVQTGAARFAFRQADRDQIWLALDLARLSEGRLAATLRDISAEREREAALEAARAGAAAEALGKSRFLANMSHELRTPLNAIMGFSDIMREKIFGSLPGKYVEYADLIHDAGSHLLDLINDVLDMSKIEAAKYELNLERLDAREPISAALRLMRVQADDVGVQLRGALPSQPMEADADRRALKQITLNLISNALKFTPRGGLVTVSLHALAGAMELSVADSGIGIADGDLERLGRPYEQAGDMGQQAKGTGLGLSLVRAFAELHGGEMAIESRLGEGTAVTIRLPVLAPKAEPDDGDADDIGASAPVRGGAQVIAFNPQR
jgi:cell cycle sensor histidine kinase DivJ